MKQLFDLTQRYKRLQFGFKNRFFTAATLLILSYCSHTYSLELQTNLPSLTIKSYGEIVLGDNSTDSLNDSKVRPLVFRAINGNSHPIASFSGLTKSR